MTLLIDPNEPELPDDMQSWQVVTMGKGNQPGMVWRKHAASMILLFRQGDHFRVLEYDGPGLAILEDLGADWQSDMLPWQDAPEGLSVWVGDVDWGRTSGGFWEEPDDPELVGKFRELRPQEWDAFDGREDTVWDWETRAVPFEEWLKYPVHLWVKMDLLGVASGVECDQVQGPRAKWPEGHRWTEKPELVTCPECLAKR